LVERKRYRGDIRKRRKRRRKVKRRITNDYSIKYFWAVLLVCVVLCWFIFGVQA